MILMIRLSVSRESSLVGMKSRLRCLVHVDGCWGEGVGGGRGGGSSDSAITGFVVGCSVNGWTIGGVTTIVGVFLGVGCLVGVWFCHVERKLVSKVTTV